MFYQFGDTALHFAVYHRHIELVEALLALKADPLRHNLVCLMT